MQNNNMNNNNNDEKQKSTGVPDFKNINSSEFNNTFNGLANDTGDNLFSIDNIDKPLIDGEILVDETKFEDRLKQLKMDRENLKPITQGNQIDFTSDQFSKNNDDSIQSNNYQQKQFKLEPSNSNIPLQQTHPSLKIEQKQYSLPLQQTQPSLKLEHSNTKQSLVEKGAKINSKVETIQNEIRKLKNENKNLQVEPLERIVESLTQEKKSLLEDRIKKESHQSLMKTVDEILGDKGVKQMAIRTILPSLNSEITNLLRKINLPHQVIFDEEFNALISHMGIEIPVQTLSTGEMKKVDFVVLIAILKLMKMKFNSINLLFLDELFSSVDPEGVYSILSILKSVAEELGLNIFVINHAPMPHEIFDYKIEIVKKNNFSGFVLDKV